MTLTDPLRFGTPRPKVSQRRCDAGWWGGQLGAQEILSAIRLSHVSCTWVTDVVGSSPVEAARNFEELNTKKA